MAVFTFCTFVTNEPSLYNNSGTESMALMIGYQSLLYLAAAFLPYQWIYFLIGNTISNALVLQYYVVNFGVILEKIIPSIVISLAASVVVSYYVEYQDKKEFLEMKQAECLQNDMKKVLQVLPEGVMIYKRFDNPHIKLWNNEFMNLFKLENLPHESL